MTDDVHSATTSSRSTLWRPASTVELVVGVVLALVLPLPAVWAAEHLAVVDRFPGLPFLIVTVTATLVGRLTASIVSVLWSGLLLAVFEVPPAGDLAAARPTDLVGVVLFAGVSLLVAFALASKDSARSQADEAGSRIEALAGSLAGERNTLRQIVQQMPIGVIVTDGTGSLIVQNARSREILEYEYLPGRDLASDDSDVPWVARRADGEPYRGLYPILRSLRTGEVVIGERMLIDRADGTAVTIDVDAAPILSPTDGSIVGAVTAFQNVTERVATEARLARATTRLQQIQAVTDATATGLTFDELAERLLATLRQILGTDSATLLIVDRSRDALIEHMTVGVETEGPAVPVPIGQGIAGTIARNMAPMVIDDLSAHEAVRHWLTDKMSSMMGVPLAYRGTIRGVVHVASRAPRRFADDEVEVLSLAANRIASALERASLYDNRAAMSQALQQSLAPVDLPEIEGVDLAALYLPFSPDDEIGGDFYDVFPHGDGSWGLVVGDVSGKGPEAAAVMGLAAHTIRAVARHESRPSAVLGALNDILLGAERVRSDRFCTACEVQLYAEPGHVHATIALAGHPTPLVMRADGRVEPVGTPGTLLGSFGDPQLHDVPVDLEPGGALVAFTDGLIERRQLGMTEGTERLAKVLSGCVGLSSS
ncbi:MAG: SpoIIE family protein phosphatase, partial [Actinomycetota bacterium]